MVSGLDIAYEAGEGPALLGRRMPDLELTTPQGPRRLFGLLHAARPVFMNLGSPESFAIARWVDRVLRVDAQYEGEWELPAIGQIMAPSALLMRPDG